MTVSSGIVGSQNNEPLSVSIVCAFTSNLLGYQPFGPYLRARTRLLAPARFFLLPFAFPPSLSDPSPSPAPSSPGAGEQPPASPRIAHRQVSAPAGGRAPLGLGLAEADVARVARMGMDARFPLPPSPSTSPAVNVGKEGAILRN